MIIIELEGPSTPKLAVANKIDILFKSVPIAHLLLPYGCVLDVISKVS